MNRMPEDFIRVAYDDMHDFVSKAAREAGLPEEKATQLATFLATNDLRGVFSHGTVQIATYNDHGYARMMCDGIVNDDPEPEVVRETPVSVLVDGDGGLGYFPAYEATESAIEKARETGIAAMASRNHSHFGAAGIYAKEAVDHDLLAFVTSGHQLDLSPGDEIYDAAGGSPMAFSVPADEEDPFVLDFGTMHDLYPHSPYRDAIAELSPGLALRHIGMGEICQSWGGLLAGLNIDEPRDYQEYEGANQGSLALFFRIDLFSEPDRFKREVDEYVRQISELEPLDGFDQALHPGGIEAKRERENRERGIPVGPEHREELNDLAGDFGIEVPWND